jgi:hypothetical protein
MRLRFIDATSRQEIQAPFHADRIPLAGEFVAIEDKNYIVEGKPATRYGKSDDGGIHEITTVLLGFPVESTAAKRANPPMEGQAHGKRQLNG